MKKFFCVPRPFKSRQPTARKFNEFDKFYEVDWNSVIGQGGFSTVYKGREKATGRLVAIKKIPRQGGSSNKVLKQEINASMKVKEHPNIVKLYDVFVAADVVILCLEFMEGDVLFKRIVRHGPLPEPLARKYFYRIALALNHLHKNNIVHRDLKPENLMFSKPLRQHQYYDGKPGENLVAELKLTDFGLSKILPEGNSSMQTFCGTPAYLAPEAWQAQFEGQLYSNLVDTWSFGVTLFVCLSGYHPFDPKGKADLKLLRDNILGLNWAFDDPGWNSVSKECRDLLQKLICEEGKRLNAEEILNSAWMRLEAEFQAGDVEGQSNVATNSSRSLGIEKSLSDKIKKLNLSKPNGKVNGKRARIEVDIKKEVAKDQGDNNINSLNVTSSFVTNVQQTKLVKVSTSVATQELNGAQLQQS